MGNNNLDKIDKEIIHKFCEGFSSYSNIAESIGISRNTVYRRVKELKEKGILDEKKFYIPNFERMGFNFFSIAMEIDFEKKKRVIELLEELKSICFVWETLGDHDLIAIGICKEGREGKNINEIKEKLYNNDLEPKGMHIWISIECKKINFDIFEEVS